MLMEILETHTAHRVFTFRFRTGDSYVGEPTECCPADLRTSH